MIRWPDAAADAQAFLLRHYNDLDVYVEDVTSKSVYDILISRALPDNIKVRSVIPLNGKDAVIAKCKRDQGAGGRRRLYIVDGDIGLIKAEPPLNLRRLYRLGVYCLENLLISEEAATEIVFEASGSLTRPQIVKEIKFRQWSYNTTRSLLKLFAVYAVADGLTMKVKTVSYNGLAMCSGAGKDKKLDSKKISARMAIIRSEVEKSITKADREMRERAIIAGIPAGYKDQMKLISGKSYLLPLLQDRLKSFDVKDTKKSLMSRFARHCDLTVDQNFVWAVRRAAAGGVTLRR